MRGTQGKFGILLVNFKSRKVTMTLTQNNLVLSLIGTETDSLKPIGIPFRQGYDSSMFVQAIRKLEFI